MVDEIITPLENSAPVDVPLPVHDEPTIAADIPEEIPVEVNAQEVASSIPSPERVTYTQRAILFLEEFKRHVKSEAYDLAEDATDELKKFVELIRGA